ncbi:DUF1777-domain-containing protein [Patellaria atrata CBS 101060]|uniref:DUF1777-domain-containing protein n=1 Tax=Patellaria atrata CBS 101060 TaxID=1346257 RepID=A0A9P4S6Q4_9PEZI|nr:DUF1777-domain-containing protein [Patellaria atrata CBS 101060]
MEHLKFRTGEESSTTSVLRNIPETHIFPDSIVVQKSSVAISSKALTNTKLSFSLLSKDKTRSLKCKTTVNPYGVRTLSPGIQPVDTLNPGPLYSEMAEPPSKRARHTDTTSKFDLSERRRDSPPRGSGRGDRRGGGRDRDHHRDRNRDGGRHRSRSRDWREGKDKDRSRDRRRDRSGSRERHKGRRDDRRTRSRSRSPARENGRDVRARSPARGPRATVLPRDRRNGALSHQKSIVAPSQPSSRPPAKVATMNGDTRMEDDGEADDEDDLETRMKKMMGFATFKTTKNTKVPGNDRNYAVRKEKKTEYRQYMNRVGGFNRPLSPSR